jgi:hypothetical protein
LPTFKNTPPSIAIEINPVNATFSSTTKKRGIIIRSASELEEFSRLLSNPKVSQLAKMLDEVNPERILQRLVLIFSRFKVSTGTSSWSWYDEIL